MTHALTVLSTVQGYQHAEEAISDWYGHQTSGGGRYQSLGRLKPMPLQSRPCAAGNQINPQLTKRSGQKFSCMISSYQEAFSMTWFQQLLPASQWYVYAIFPLKNQYGQCHTGHTNVAGPGLSQLVKELETIMTPHTLDTRNLQQCDMNVQWMSSKAYSSVIPASRFHCLSFRLLRYSSHYILFCLDYCGLVPPS